MEAPGGLEPPIKVLQTLNWIFLVMMNEVEFYATGYI